MPLNKTWLKPQTTSIEEHLKMTLILTVTNTNIHISQSLFVDNDKKLFKQEKQWGYIMLSTSFVKGAKTRKSQTKHYLDTTLAKDTI